MNLLTVSTDLISIFLFTTLFLFFARKVAKKVGLVDKPNFRKRHQGLIPLVGGISVYAGICFTFGMAIIHKAVTGLMGWVLPWVVSSRIQITVKPISVLPASPIKTL